MRLCWLRVFLGRRRGGGVGRVARLFLEGVVLKSLFRAGFSSRCSLPRPAPFPSPFPLFGRLSPWLFSLLRASASSCSAQALSRMDFGASLSQLWQRTLDLQFAPKPHLPQDHGGYFLPLSTGDAPSVITGLRELPWCLARRLLAATSRRPLPLAWRKNLESRDLALLWFRCAAGDRSRWRWRCRIASLGVFAHRPRDGRHTGTIKTTLSGNGWDALQTLNP